MTIRACNDLSSLSVKSFLEENRTDSTVCIILCFCVVEYEGRAEGILPGGNRTIIWKPDGNFLVIGSTKHKPRNWQPTGATTTLSTEDSKLLFTSKRTKPLEETLRVIAEDIHDVTVYEAGSDPDVIVQKTESDMHEYIMSYPERAIEQGFTPIENESRIDDGRAIDIYGIDRKQTQVVIEVKRRRAQRKDVDQLDSYTATLRETQPVTRGILVAPSAGDSVKSALKTHNLEFIKLDPLSIPDQ